MDAVTYALRGLLGISLVAAVVSWTLRNRLSHDWRWDQFTPERRARLRELQGRFDVPAPHRHVGNAGGGLLG